MIKHFCDRCGNRIPTDYNLDPRTIALSESTFKDNIDVCPNCMREFAEWWKGMMDPWKGVNPCS